MYERLRPIAQKVETLLSELCELSQCGPRLRIVHRFHIPNTECRDGEEIWAVSLNCHSHYIPLQLALAPRLLIDYLGRTRHVPQSSTQIVSGIAACVFYNRHGANSQYISRRKISRPSIKEYVKRIRQALYIALSEASLSISAERVLISKKTTSNEIFYQLHAQVEWLHIDIANRDAT